jgi:UDP-2,4-diacetamido-2,4,6-trideoxy-beta-L-altropyranose hydrolase
VTRPGSFDGQALVLRADASSRAGTGHLMRILALGQAWADAGGAVTCVTACDRPGLLRRLRDEGFEVERLERGYPDRSDLGRMREVLTGRPGAWVAVDGYHFDEAYLGAVARLGHPVLYVDDLAGLMRYDVDLVVNQNAHAEGLRYPASPRARLLLGPRYVLLRREFREKRPARRVPATARHLLVLAGGADPHHVTERALDALARIDRSELATTVVVGAANRRAASIAARAERLAGDVTVVRGATNVADMMAGADLALSTAGTTVWELAYMGVPSLLIEAGPAERLLLDGLDHIGLFDRVGEIATLDADTLAGRLVDRLGDRAWRAAMAELARATVDGLGGERVLAAMAESSVGVGAT